MMRNTIVRSMATSTIKAYSLVIVDGKPVAKELEPITVMGKVNDREALKAVKDAYGKDTNVTIGSVEVSENQYEISVSDFVKHATKIK